MTSSGKPPLEILLFDMDGVLLVPAGYHRALQETIALIGRALGWTAARITPEAIAQFEAAGATSEWDSSAICTAYLLTRLWEIDPDGRLTPDSLTQPPPAHPLPPPDFLALAQALADLSPNQAPPLARAEKLLVDQLPPRPNRQRSALLELLHGARDIHRTLTHRLFQEHILGSEIFAATYGLAPLLDLPGYLATYDRPTLAPEVHAALLGWLAAPGHRAAVFTNRPTQEPGGRGGTPEGELGQETTGLQRLPLIGWGHLTWLSETRGLSEDVFGKPAAAHALAALRCALGEPVETALQAAADLQTGGNAAGWEPLAGARISAFEDGAAGLVSARSAGALLAQQGVPMEIHLFGIAREEPKRRALEDVGGQVFEDLAPALAAAGVIRR